MQNGETNFNQISMLAWPHLVTITTLIAVKN